MIPWIDKGVPPPFFYFLDTEDIDRFCLKSGGGGGGGGGGAVGCRFGIIYFNFLGFVYFVYVRCLGYV